MSSEEVRVFVDALQEVVSRCQPQSLRRVPVESCNPSLWRFYLDEEVLKKTLETVSESLSQTDVTRLKTFFRQNLEDELLMASAKMAFEIRRDQRDPSPTTLPS